MPHATYNSAIVSPLPLISVVMANHNGGRFLEHAMDSVLSQLGVRLELLVIDDASTDDSAILIQEMARRDARVRMFPSAQNVGPASARNIGIDHAGGTWIAIVDSDDLLHPARLMRLLDFARETGSDIVADDLLQFDEDGRDPPKAVLGLSHPRRIELPAYIRSNAIFARGPAYGYLKPLFRTETTFGRGIRYDPTLRIAEDYDLVFRMLRGGAHFEICPNLTYFYRKHGASISHRLLGVDLRAMLAADEASLAARPVSDGNVAAAMTCRRASLLRALAFTCIVEALKGRQPVRALRLAAQNPASAALLMLPLKAAAARLRPNRPPPPARGRNICIISRQRIVGSNNGSSAYVLDLCKTMVAHGWRIHLMCPSPAVFGRWPALLLQREMDVFTSLRIRGGIRVGRIVVSRDYRIALSACVTVAMRIARRLGLRRRVPEQPAPYAVAVPWLADDQIYLARHARECGDVLIADYAFLTAGFAYALRPEAPRAVIMHDLFSSRAEQFARAGEMDSVAALSADEEYAMLGQADMILAIQEDEAVTVREHLPGTPVLTAPMSLAVVADAQPGRTHSLLFVGGNTAPNIIGLNWFLEEVWPGVLSHFPETTMLVAGHVGAFAKPARRMRRLGRVADLSTLYRDSAVVISPLPMGSGLKIKLIEAMAHGKAIVASPASLQGLPTNVHDAVIEADSAEAFRKAIVYLLGDVPERERRGDKARRLAEILFSRATAHAALVGWLEQVAGVLEGEGSSAIDHPAMR